MNYISSATGPHVSKGSSKLPVHFNMTLDP